MNQNSFFKLQHPNQSFQNIKSNTKSNLIRQKNRTEQLLNRIYESQQEIKRLNLMIEKLHQKEKNSLMFYQTKIQELQNLNKDYLLRIQHYQLQKAKIKKINNPMLQSKIMTKSIHKNYIQSSHKKKVVQFFDNKQNINENSNINIQSEESMCLSCSSIRNKELQNIKDVCVKMNEALQNVLYSIKIRQLQKWNEEDYQKWRNQMQNQKNIIKKDIKKGPLSFLKKIQQKINKIQLNFISEKPKCQTIKDTLIQSLNLLKLRQRQLIKIPYLQKIDIINNKKQLDNIIQNCKLKQEYILNMIKQ